MTDPEEGRLRRLAEELEESGLPLAGSEPLRAMLLEEVDFALRPTVHERRIPSSGTIVEPRSDQNTWGPGTELKIDCTPVLHQPLPASRRFVDGLSSWLLRRTGHQRDAWVLFDRPAGSERDLVVLADVLDTTIVQRHPTGAVRIVGSFGVLRWQGLAWHHEPPVATWVGTVTSGSFVGKQAVIEAMLRFAVHDLGSLGIGSLLIYRPEASPGPPVEDPLSPPLPLRICTPSHLAPLRQALSQIDGAAVFDAEGVLRQLGVRLVPSPTAQRVVNTMGGTRHTSGLRYSHDDPSATVIAVSEDGPVSVLREGQVVERPAT
jgi:hypothetical protein